MKQKIIMHINHQHRTKSAKDSTRHHDQTVVRDKDKILGYPKRMTHHLNGDIMLKMIN